MPSKSQVQAFAAQQAMDIKTGKMPASSGTRGAVSMSKMPVDKLKHFMKMKECLSPEGKEKLLTLLKYFQQLAKEEYTGNVGGETDIRNADNLQVNEDEFTAAAKPHRNIVAKTFDTSGDFDSYVNQRRGIEMTPKEQQSISGYSKAKPVQQDKFFVRYEKTDEFGNNATTVIKKLKEGEQFVWTAFSKHESAEEEGKPEGAEEEPALKEQTPPAPENDEGGEEITVNDPIRVIKTVTFTDDVEGADLLLDLLEHLDI